MRTIREEVAEAQQRFRAAGIRPSEADLDARLLAQFALGWDASQYFTSSRQETSADFSHAYGALVARRESREPLAYITGEREFWGLMFHVTPSVLIPRPETELLVEGTIAAFPDRTQPLAIADVCTGSGCLAVALAREYANARVVATDISPAALEIAKQNARRHGVDERIRFVQTPLLAGVSDRFHAIVSNPPYIPEGDRPSLQAEIREYEPPVALFGGAEGLTILQRLVAEAARALTGEGVFLCEFGFGQAAPVRELISATAGLTMGEFRHDLQGIPRVAVARRRQVAT